MDDLNQRGITQKTIDSFHIGYAKGGLKEYLLEDRGFSAELCQSVGVLKEQTDGSYKDFFYKRIIYSIFLQRNGYLSYRTFPR